MKNKNKGFTLLELLAAIVILGILTTLAFASVTGLTDRAREEEELQYNKTLKMAAESYMQANKSALPKAVGEHTSITATELRQKRYLKEGDKGCVEVYKETNTKYVYKVKTTCTSSSSEDTTCSPPPVIDALYFTDASLQPTADHSNLEDAILYVKMNGGKDAEGNKVAIDGYSYTLYLKTASDPNFHEVFNSGTLSANGNTDITIQRKVKDYIDVTGANDVAAKVTVFNKSGCSTNKSTDPTVIGDTTPPICTNISGQATSADDWINKNNSQVSRIITATCDDGKGSGCIRPIFTRSWPNDYQKDAEYAYIQVKDNAGNANVDEDTFIKPTNLCSTPAKEDTCRVRINVDQTTPTIVVQGAYKATSGGNKTGSNYLKNGTKTVTDTTGNGSIGSSEYPNLSANGYWMNNEMFPEGVVYEIEISDSIHLNTWKWETNKPYITSTTDNAYSSYSVNNDRYAKEVANSTTNWSGNCGTRSKKILVGFNAEGRRKGILTVTDKAGNVITLTIEANLDRQPPPVPAVVYTENYQPGTTGWTNKVITASVPNTYKRDDTSGPAGAKVTLSGWKLFNYHLKKEYETFDKKPIVGQELSFDKKLEGKNQIEFNSCDVAGNCCDYSGLKPIWVDFTAPDCEVKTTNHGSLSSGWLGIGETATVTSTCTEVANAKRSGCYNGTTANDYKSTYSQLYDYDLNTSHAGARGLNNGGKIRDIAGNVTTCAANQTIKIDYQSPSCVVTGESTSWARTRTIYRTCRDNPKNNVSSGCTTASTITDKYQTDNKTIKTVSFVTYSISDVAGNGVTCSKNPNGNKSTVDVYMDRQAPTCKGTKSNTTHTDGTHNNGKGNPNGITISYACSDAGVGGYKCPATKTGAKSNQSHTVKDSLGNSMTCSVTVSSMKEYRYRKKDAPGRCTSSCCGYKTCRTSACGCQTYNSGTSCSNCGSYYTKSSYSCSRSGSGNCCASGYGHSCSTSKSCSWSHYGAYASYRCTYRTSCSCIKYTKHCKTCRHKNHGCQTYYSCSAKACGNKTCTSAKCCGYVCGTSNWNAWGGSNNKCNPDSRNLYY